MSILTDFHFAALSYPLIALGVGALVLIGLAVCMRDWVKAQFECRSFRFSLEAGTSGKKEEGSTNKLTGS